MVFSTPVSAKVGAKGGQMSVNLNSKSVLFHDLPPALSHALRQQLGSVQIVEGSDQPQRQSFDLVVCGGGTAPLRPGIACVRIGAKARLGSILADIYRAVDEPALAVMPFTLAGDMFYPAEKKLERSDGSEIILTERETTLLLYLAKRAPQAVSREAILRDVWRYQDGIDTHTLETHIYRLRQKIERDSGHPATLLTTTEGYALSDIGPST